MPHLFQNYEDRIKKEPDEAVKMLRNLSDAVRFLQDKITGAINDLELPEGTIASMFSDTIVVSILKTESAGVLYLFELLKELQINLLMKDILLRGGIVYGKLVHTENLIIGPALVNAHNLESKSALYPRIVIDPKVLRLYIRENGEQKESLRLADYEYHFTFKEDFDGTSYIDYFNSVKEYTPLKDINEYFVMMNELIMTGTRSRDIGIRMKYMWMKNKLKDANYSVEEKYQWKTKALHNKRFAGRSIK